MPTTVQAALLGIVQGVTEFLPVSSSAHLILARAFFGWDADRFGLAFDVACHVGTLVAVLIYFHREIGQMVAAIPHVGRPDRAPAAGLLWRIAVGTIPAVIVGLTFGEAIERHLRTPLVAAIALLLGSAALFAAERTGRKTRTDETLTVSEAWWIGCAQAAALVPGISRSGATLTLALLLGLRRAAAARFIFLLAIPAILAAAASEAPRLVNGGFDGGMADLFVVGLVSSAAVGYAAVRLFMRYLAQHSLDVFVWYRVALSGVAGIWLLR